MKLSRSHCRILGVQTGELTLNVTGPTPLLRVKFALIAEGGGTAGYFEKSTTWSETTQELLQKLTDSLEADALPYIFEEPVEELDPSQPIDEPPQL